MSAPFSPAEYRAKLLHLFGAPLRSSILADEAFGYVIEATDENGNTLILTAYEGASGPAIGARSLHCDESDHQAGQELVELIRQAKPADFEATLYDLDTDNTVWYGFKDGNYYYREERGKHVEE